MLVTSEKASMTVDAYPDFAVTDENPLRSFSAAFRNETRKLPGFRRQKLSYHHRSLQPSPDSGADSRAWRPARRSSTGASGPQNGTPLILFAATSSPSTQIPRHQRALAGGERQRRLFLNRKRKRTSLAKLVDPGQSRITLCCGDRSLSILMAVLHRLMLDIIVVDE
jgi:hypothetical protein